ncbi:MAG TPA: class I SAM-dependent methyltransferase [Candidatus Limnocylindria bacterium]|nr:class I SAM-dependent methyltransferase [Candidatus Limnocylindria bacterium]
MTGYQPREFWDRRLSEQFDLRGTGETGLSLAYNRACYALRHDVLERALRVAGFDPAGQRVLDVGCGTGFFTAYYLARGARVTGVDIAPTSIERLRARHPEATFVQGDVSEGVPGGPYQLVNAFDVLYHITDDGRWERALAGLAGALVSGGLLLVTDAFAPLAGAASHNRMRPLATYRAVLERNGMRTEALHPTHVLLNRELGPFRFLNRLPGLLLAVDRAVLALRPAPGVAVNKLLVARRG